MIGDIERLARRLFEGFASQFRIWAGPSLPRGPLGLGKADLRVLEFVLRWPISTFILKWRKSIRMRLMDLDRPVISLGLEQAAAVFTTLFNISLPLCVPDGIAHFESRGVHVKLPRGASRVTCGTQTLTGGVH